MKKVFCALLAALTLLAAAVVPAYAVDSSKSYLFELSIDGSDTKHAAAGDIVTVLLTLKRTDKDEGYTMYAMQDEICYDPAFYMNFVSFGGGEDWDASTMIGTFQLKVIGTSGSSVIRNTENLVSTADGMDSYAAEARDVTVVVTDDCTVKFESNGGSFVPEQVVKRGQRVTRPEDPTREGFVLEGWYTDFDMTRPWDFDRDTVTASMTLYARWTDGTAVAPVDENGGGQVPVWVWIALGALLLLLVLFLLLRRRTVRFETFGGTAIDSRKVRRGEKLTPPMLPVKEGAAFGGWFADQACTKLWSFDSDTVEKSMTLYAKWQ